MFCTFVCDFLNVWVNIICAHFSRIWALCMLVCLVLVCLFVSVCVCAGQSGWHGCQFGPRPASYIQTFTAVATVLCGSPDSLHSKNAHPQLIQVSLRANCASCRLRGRGARNAEQSGAFGVHHTSPPYYDAFDKFITSGFANDFERQVSALLKACWQQWKPASPLRRRLRGGAAWPSVDSSAR